MPKNWVDLLILLAEAGVLIFIAVDVFRSVRLISKVKRRQVTKGPGRKKPTARRSKLFRLQRLKFWRNQLDQPKGGEISRTGDQEQGIVVMSELQDQTGG